MEMNARRRAGIRQTNLCCMVFLFSLLSGLTECDGDEQNLKRQASRAKDLRNKAMKHAMNGDCQSAAPIYEELVSLDPAVVSAEDYNNFGVCLQDEGKHEYAVSTYQSGIKLFYHNEKLHRNLGELLEDMSKSDIEQQQSWTDETDQRSMLSLTHLTFALRLQLARLWEKYGGDAPKQKRIGVGRKTIAFFSRQRNEEELSDGQWGPKYVLEDGVNPEHGEDSLTFIARHLVKMGFNVEIYGNPPAGETGMDEHGVMWMPFYAIHPMLPPVWNESHVLWPKLPTAPQPDVFVSWRNYEGAHLFNSSVHEARNITPPVSYLWVHDIVRSPAVFTPPYSAPLHGIILNNQFQAAMMTKRVSHCFFTTSGAVEQEPPFVIRQTENQNRRFLYAGSPLSGLEVVLSQWSGIRAALLASGGKEPVLEVLFGFSAAHDRQYEGRRWYEQLQARISKLLDQEGVVFRHPLSQRKVARAYAAAGFYLYPTTQYDINAHHVMKAMAMGAIPVTNRSPLSTLREVTAQFDLGPVPDQGAQDANAWVQRWTEAVIAAASRPEEELTSFRESMVAEARARFQWTKVANQWAERFRAHIETGNTSTCGDPIPQVVTRKDPSERPSSDSEAPESKAEL